MPQLNDKRLQPSTHTNTHTHTHTHTHTERKREREREREKLRQYGFARQNSRKFFATNARNCQPIVSLLYFISLLSPFIISSLAGWQIKKKERAEECEMYGGGAYTVLKGKLEGKRPPGITRAQMAG